MKIEELYGYDIDTEEIKYIIEKYHAGENMIVVTGEFSSGKSSFINCYLNKKDFLPYGNEECTPVLIDISEGKEERIEVRTVEGEVSHVDHTKENIKEYAEFHKDSQRNQDILSISVPVWESGLPKGVHLIDTPGTNTVLKEHEEITKYIIKKADAVLYLFNKVIAQSDIKHICNILEHTKNIIFVLTHADEEDSKTGKKYTSERINELLDEAKKEISKGTDIDVKDMIAFAVGSFDGYADRTGIDEIKAAVTRYVESQSKEKRKRLAVRKIEDVIRTAIDNYSFKKEVLEKQMKSDNDEIEKKIRKYEREQSTSEKDHENRVNNIERMIQRCEEDCKSDFNRLLFEERQAISSLLDSSEVDEKMIKNRLEQMNKNISIEMRQKIEKSISDISENVYKSVNEELKEMVNEFEVSVPVAITPPVIEELDDSRLIDKLYKVEKEIEENIKDCQRLSNDSQSNSQKKAELENQIRKYEVQKENVRGKLTQLGAYKPKYDEIETEGGGNMGKMIGRGIGEIADIALLIWNPVGGAAKAADAAMDARTLVRYLTNSIKKVDEGRREVIDKVEETAGERGGVSMMLDLLSLGFWAEKAGEKIGEAITPTKVTKVENLENKEAYEKEREQIVSETDYLSSEIMNLKSQLLEIDDFGKQCRVESELKERERALEAKKAELERVIEHERKTNSTQQIKDHYNLELEQYEQNQRYSGESLLQVIFQQAKMRLAERVTMDYEDKMEEFRKLIAGLKDDISDGGLKIEEYEKNINALSESINDVGMWFE